MPSPIPGKKYTVVKGDTLLSISARSYGNEMLWSKIYRANADSLRSHNADLIYPGEVLFIPGEAEVATAPPAPKPSPYASKPRGSFTLVIDGREVLATDITFKTGITTLSSSWVATIPWRQGENEWLDQRTRRGSFSPGELYLGPELVGRGRLYRIQPKVTTGGSTKVLEFSTATADLVDSSMVPPYEFGGINLKALAGDYLTALGYQVLFLCPPGAPFDTVKATASEKIGAFLTRLAAQRGMLVTDNESGAVVFLEAATSGAAVAVFEEGKPPLQEFEADFDDRKRFHVYAAVGGSGDGSPVSDLVRDDAVPGIRLLRITADDVDQASVKDSAKWRRAKALADAYTLPLSLPDWYDDAGQLWRKNTLVSLKAPSLDLPKPTALLVKDIEFKGSKAGRSAVLEVCPPFALAGGDIPKEWL